MQRADRPEAAYLPRFFEVNDGPSYRSALKFLKHLFAAYQPHSIVDFGCGSGAWLRAAADLGVTDLTGLDGDWVERRSFAKSINFVPASLEQTINLERKYDLAISLEVIEHLSPRRGNSFVLDLCNASDVVLFSGAVPGQGGIRHLNERWQSHWISTFSDQGFQCLDAFRSRFWHDDNIQPWYRQNAFLFVRRSCRTAVDVSRLSSEPLYDIVHPQVWRARAEEFNPRALSGTVWLKALPYIAMRQLHRLTGRKAPDA